MHITLGQTLIQRGLITTDELKYLRRYPSGELYAHVTGFYSFVFGRTELEQAYNDYLAEEWISVAPQRYIGMAYLPFWDMDATLAEIFVRLTGRGLAS